MSDLIYRKGSQAIILNPQNEFLVVQLKNYGDNDWNFPGGGQEDEETPRETIIREMREELGITEEDYEIIAQAKEPIKYTFPKPLVDPERNIEYIGQIKEQFLFRIKDTSKIQVNSEIKRYKWISFDELKSHLIFPNQYESALVFIRELLPELLN